VLINPARSPSIFRRRFPIRSWYPSQHLLRQNPLPRSQFEYRRRFPRAASQPQTVVRPACRGQRSRGPRDDHSQEARRRIDLGDGGGAAIQSWEHASATDRKVEAEAELRAATRADPTFEEDGYNFSDLLDEQGRSEAAIDCLRRALQADPDYADAMFNLALLLQRANQPKEAAEYWRQYLATPRQWHIRHRSTAEDDSRSAVADRRPQCLIPRSRARRSRATEANSDSTGACPKGDVHLQRLTWRCAVNAVTKPHGGRSVGFSLYNEMEVGRAGGR